MDSGSFKKAFTSLGYELRVEWSSTDTISSNSSAVKVTAKLYCPYRLNINGREDNKIVINGTNYYYDSSSINGTGTYTLGSVTSGAIKHNADGSKSISISCSFAVNATISGTYYGTITASDTVDLDDIPRAATITSAPNFNDEQNPTIKYSNPAGNAVTTLRACISLDGSTDDIAYRDISKTGSSYTFELTDAERKVLRQATTGSNSRSVRFYVMSVIGGETYRKSVAKTFSIINGAPTLNPTVKDIGEVSITLTGDAEYSVIKGYNVMEVAANATAKKEATIKSYKISCGGKSITTASGKLSYVESGTFTFTVTDSRGNVVTQKVTKELIDYNKVTCSLAKGKFTTDGVITFTIKGNFWQGNFGAVENALDVKYKCYEQGGSGEWVAATATINDNNTYTADVSVSGLDYQKKYVIMAYAADAAYKFENDDAVETPQKVMACIPVFDWSAEDFNFNVDIKAQENFIFKNGGVGIRGTTTAGEEIQALQPCNSNNNCVLGYGGYSDAIGATNVYGNEVKLISNGSVTVNGMEIAENKVLWSGEYYMTETQTAKLSEAVSKQANGIVLVFSRYNEGAAVSEAFSSHFVPKQMIKLHAGNGHNFNLCGMWANGMKYLYIKDEEITGHANNKGERTVGGITYNNSYYVLRYVIGV